MRRLDPWAVLIGLAVGVIAFVLLARGDEPEPALVDVSHDTTPGRVIAVFVDSLSEEVATSSSTMPTLARLAEHGASLAVEPCRDQLTYLCLRAVLTGRDESSLLSLHRNFDNDRQSSTSTLLSEVARRDGRVVLIGSKDFLPYRSAIAEFHHIRRRDESPATVLAALAKARRASPAALTVVSLSSGDRAAHEHGVNGPEYVGAFSNLDRIVGALDAQRDPDTHLVVFGDHGHDAAGRHLPGTASKTWAVYVGPAFRAGYQGQLAITQHRSLLGLLLGVPIPGAQPGSSLKPMFRNDWVQEHLGGWPDLEADSRATPSATPRWARAAAVAVATAVALWLLIACWVRDRALQIFGAMTLTATAAALGAGYDAVRAVVHDHGYSPARALFLLVPVVIGFGVAAALRRGGVLRRALPGAWLPTGGAAALVACFLLLLPTAYFYGSGRAIAYAAVLAVAVLALDMLREALPLRRRARFVAAAGVSVVALITFFGVRPASATSREGAAFVLTAAVYQGSAWIAFALAKVGLLAWLLSLRTHRRGDLAAAALLLAVSLGAQISGADLGRAFYGLLTIGLVLSLGIGRHRLPATRLGAGLLLLNHFYEGQPVQLAPIEVLLAATGLTLAACSRATMRSDSRDAAQGLTVLTAAYLLLWPILGFRFSGIDFRFMFQWVPVDRFEDGWWLIALGMAAKTATPYILLAHIARATGLERPARKLVATALGAKAALLATICATYAATDPSRSRVSTDMLSELALVVVAALCLVPLFLSRPSRPAAPGDHRHHRNPSSVSHAICSGFFTYSSK